MSAVGVTQSRFRVTATLNGNDLGVWETRSGGDIKSNVTAHNPGGGAPQVALSGTKTVNQMTVGRAYQPARDNPLVPVFTAACGTGTLVIRQVPLDPDNNAWGAPRVWTAVLDSFTDPTADSNSNSPATITFTGTIVGNPSGGGA